MTDLLSTTAPTLTVDGGRLWDSLVELATTGASPRRGLQPDRREGAEPELGPVLTGSHIDAVATAGAQEMAAITPTAMIFVWGGHDGISHNPREFSTPETCTAGIDVLRLATR